MTTKEIRNYIHNDLGIDKQSVQSMVRAGIKEEVTKYIEQELKDENKWSAFIDSELRRLILDAADNKRFSYLHCTVDKLYHKIDEEIHNEVLKRLNVSLVPSEEVKRTLSTDCVDPEELKTLVKQVYDLTKRDFEIEDIMAYLQYHDMYSVTKGK